MHCDPASGKVKFLSLGRWRGTLEQENIQVKYIKLSDHLDMLGVKLKATYTQTRKVNGDEMKEKLSNFVNSWRGGRYMQVPETLVD